MMIIRAIPIFIFVQVAALCFRAGVVSATVISVPGDSATIQAGIDGASNGDTVLVASGTYAGDGNRDLAITGKQIVVMSEKGSDSTVIDCGGTAIEPHRGFHLIDFTTDSTTIIDGFTIQNGHVTNEVGPRDGGGIRLSDASPTIRNCILVNNTAQFGGAIAIAAGGRNFTVLEDSRFTGNSVSRDGGGIHIVPFPSALGPSVAIRSCEISENLTPNGSGGGLYVHGDSVSGTLNDC